MKRLYFNTLVVGSGCAGLNAMDTLSDKNITDIALITEGLYQGTSRNTGSDKQTYYKLSLAGGLKDSVADMAQTLSASGEVDKEVCYTEAANSVECFLKLAHLGVKFPTNAYGEYVGYQTDHDESKRATSAGPLTSKQMWEVLYHSVASKNLTIIDGYTVIKIIMNQGKAQGILALKGDEVLYVGCQNLILATGGPSGIYRDSVYPESQRGMSALSLIAGTKAVNLHHFQYGIASTSFRWNLSGTYQQAIPRYVSIDEEGVEREFLTETHLPLDQIYSFVFLKGYQWPFDSKKISGSSLIDLFVHQEKLKKRRVYLDYRTNPQGFSLHALSEEALHYLEKSNGLLDTPIQRLESMNPLAVKLYKDHGIDLHTDLLEISVCAQNHNGGIKVDCHWQSDIENVFVIGEAAGTFAAYRPGGTALNSTQVSSLRAATEIQRRALTTPPSASLKYTKRLFSNDELLAEVEKIDTIKQRKAKKSALSLMKKYQSDMSDYASFMRDYDRIHAMKQELDALLPSFFDEYGVSETELIVDAFTSYDALVEMRAVLSAMEFAADNIGSYGGAVTKKSGEILPFLGMTPDKRIVTTKDTSSFETIKPFIKKEDWFETVWKEYRKNNGER